LAPRPVGLNRGHMLEGDGHPGPKVTGTIDGRGSTATGTALDLEAVGHPRVHDPGRSLRHGTCGCRLSVTPRPGPCSAHKLPLQIDQAGCRSPGSSRVGGGGAAGTSRAETPRMRFLLIAVTLSMLTQQAAQADERSVDRELYNSAQAIV